MVYQPDRTLAAAYGFAERLRLAVSGIDWTTVAPDIHVTVSLGVACGPAEGWQVALTAADGRLLAAKQRGRNAVVSASTGPSSLEGGTEPGHRRRRAVSRSSSPLGSFARSALLLPHAPVRLDPPPTPTSQPPFG
jgi:hypothetical protein